MAAPILSYEGLGLVQGSGWLFQNLDIYIGERDRLALIGRDVSFRVMPKRVLCLITDGFEEIETVTPIDLLRRAQVEVRIVSPDGKIVTGRSGIKLLPDGELDHQAAR